MSTGTCMHVPMFTCMHKFKVILIYLENVEVSLDYIRPCLQKEKKKRDSKYKLDTQQGHPLWRHRIVNLGGAVNCGRAHPP